MMSSRSALKAQSQFFLWVLRGLCGELTKRDCLWLE